MIITRANDNTRLRSVIADFQMEIVLLSKVTAKILKGKMQAKEMDPKELLEKFQNLRKKFVRNFTERQECEKDRLEVERQRRASIREKWLKYIEDGTQEISDEKKLSLSLIEETIQLCTEHIKGLDVDLARLEDERIQLLVEQDNLKRYLHENDNKQDYPRTVNTGRNVMKQNIKNGSTNLSNNPPTQASVKVGRKYELQRKIDLELEKLYKQMEADGTLVKDGIGHEDLKPTATAEKISDEKETVVSPSGDVMDGKMNGENTQQVEEQQDAFKDNEVAPKQPQESNTPEEEDKDIGTDKDVRMNGDVAQEKDVEEHEEISRNSPEIIITKCDGESETVDRAVNIEDKQNEITGQESTTNVEIETDLESNINNETESQQELQNGDIHNSQEQQSETQIDKVEPNDMMTEENTAVVEEDVQDTVEEPTVVNEVELPAESQSLEEEVENDSSHDAIQEPTVVNNVKVPVESQSREEDAEKESAQVALETVVNVEKVPVESQSLEEEETEKELTQVALETVVNEEDVPVESQSLKEDTENESAQADVEEPTSKEPQSDEEEIEKDSAVVAASDVDKASDDGEEVVLQEKDDEVKEDLAPQNIAATGEEEIGVEADANMKKEGLRDAPLEKTDETEAKEEINVPVQIVEEAEKVDENLGPDLKDEEVIESSVAADVDVEDDDDTIEAESAKDEEEVEIVEENLIQKSENSSIEQIQNEPQQKEEKHETVEEHVNKDEESSTAEEIKEDAHNQIEVVEEAALNEGTSVDQIDGGIAESNEEGDLADQAQTTENENTNADETDDVQLAVLSQEVEVDVAVDEKTEPKQEEEKVEDDLNLYVAKEDILVLDEKDDVIDETPPVCTEDGTSVDVAQKSNEENKEEIYPQDEMSSETSEDKQQVQIIDNEDVVHPTEDEKNETSKESTEQSDQNISTKSEGSEMEKATPVMFSGDENQGITAEDIAEDMKDRPSSSQQSTPSYQDLVGDVDEEVRQNEELENAKDEEVVEEQHEEDDSSSTASSTSNSDEDFSGNDIDLEDPNEYLDQSESLQQDEGTSVDAPQIAPLDDVSDKSVVSDEDTGRLATEIVNEAVNLAIAYIDNNNEESESEIQQTDVECCAGDNDVTTDGTDVRSYTVNDIEDIERETTEKESRIDAIELPTESYQKDEGFGDIEIKQTEAVEKEEKVLEETHKEEDLKEQEEEKTEEAVVEASSKDQQDSAEKKEEKENDMPKPVYNPALSQRNTEAEKWFGQPTQEDKIFMRPKGKLDMSAEMERKKLIKSMTRRNNPKIVSKWQPPTEKNWEDNLEGQQKESLEKYKQRRQNRISFSSHPTDDNTSDKPQVENKVEETPVEQPSPEKQSEDIVVEPVVHSRDAISKWEHILHEKTEKEEAERKRLSVGKQQRNPRPFEMHRTRKDSDSSVSSNTSSNAPPSDMIVRESMNIKDIRNRWKNIEEESKQTKPPTNYRRQSTGTNRGGNTFTVKAAPMYRPYMRSSTTVTEEQPNLPEPVNHPRKPKSKIIPGESFIDREIREAAEREEEYKHEFASKSPEPAQKESKVLEEDVVAKLKKLPSQHTEDIITQTIKEDAEKESQWKEEHHVPPHTDTIQKDDVPQVQGDAKIVYGGLPGKTITPHHKETDAESISSYGSSGMSNEAPLSPASRKKSSKTQATSTESRHQEADSGIECNNQISSSSPEPKPVVVEAPVQAVLTRQKTASEFQDELLKNLEVDEPVASTVEPKQLNQRARLSSLHTVTPKGWGQTPTTAKAISPVSPGHKKVLAPFSTKKTNGVESSTEVKQITPNTFKVTPQKNTNNHNNRGMYDDNHWNGALRKTVDSPQKKAGPVFQITSSNVSTQSAMKKEIEDAKRREEEWLRKQRAVEAEKEKQQESQNVNNNNNIVNNNHISPPKPVARKQVGEGVAGAETAE